MQCKQYASPASDTGAYRALSQMLSGKDLDTALHYVRCLLQPKQQLRLTVQQALQADVLQL